MLADIQHALELLFATAPQGGKKAKPSLAPPPPSGDVPSDDAELLDLIRRSIQGTKFIALYDRGDLSVRGGDASSAALSLCCILVFWCGPDAERVARIFRTSRLMRAKWDEPRRESTWGRDTIAKAMQFVTVYYRGPGSPMPDFNPPPGDGAERPADGGQRPNAGSAAATGNRFVAAFKRASEVKPTTVQWVWDRRVPVGRMSVLAGHGGLGKSVVTAHTVACITTPKFWPGKSGTLAKQGSVIMMCAEDDDSDTTVPCLMAAGADLDKVILLEGKKPNQTNPDQAEGFVLGITCQDVDIIAEAAEAAGDVRLIVVDPIGSYLGGQVDAYRDNEVRAVIDPLIKLARQIGAGLLVVAHVNKGINQRADDAILGSRAFTTLSRSVLHLMADPENKGRFYLAPGKMNIGKGANTLAYRMEVVSVPDAGPQPKLVWEDEEIEDTTADDILGGNGRSRSGPAPNQEQRAIDFLEDVLRCEPCGMESTELAKGAEAAGITEATLRRAKEKLGVKSKQQKGSPRRNKDRKWYCGIGDNWEPPSLTPGFYASRVGSDGMSIPRNGSPQVVTGQGLDGVVQTNAQPEHPHGGLRGDAQVRTGVAGNGVSGGTQVPGDAQVKQSSEHPHNALEIQGNDSVDHGDAHVAGTPTRARAVSWSRVVAEVMARHPDTFASADEIHERVNRATPDRETLPILADIKQALDDLVNGGQVERQEAADGDPATFRLAGREGSR